MAEWLLQHRQYFERSGARMHFSILMIVLISGIMLLHVAESSMWAAFYYAGALFPAFETSVYFSLVTYTAIGYGDVVLPQKWRLLGALQGDSGVCFADSPLPSSSRL